MFVVVVCCMFVMYSRVASCSRCSDRSFSYGCFVRRFSLELVIVLDLEFVAELVVIDLHDTILMLLCGLVG